MLLFSSEADTFARWENDLKLPTEHSECYRPTDAENGKFECLGRQDENKTLVFKDTQHGMCIIHNFKVTCNIHVTCGFLMKIITFHVHLCYKNMGLSINNVTIIITISDTSPCYSEIF